MTYHMITVEILSNPTEKDLQNINALIPQIAREPHLLSLAELNKVVMQKENCKLVVARAFQKGERPIVGMAVITLRPILTGLLADVEDVVVDENWRGEGVGRAINQKLIDIARNSNAKHISLHTNKARVAANAMYQQMGYKKLEDVNYYRINLLLPVPSSKEEIDFALSRRIKKDE